MSDEALAAYTAKGQLTHVWVRENSDLKDLSFLRGQTQLAHADLRVAGAATDTSALGTLHGLATLRFFTHPRAQVPFSLSCLSPQAPLKVLSLAGAALPENGLEPIRRYLDLHTLTVARSHPYTLSAADWAAIASLPRLRTLSIPDSLIPAAPMVSLTSVEVLRLASDRWDDVLERIPRLCPSLQSLTLYGGHPDLSPLAALPQLRTVHLYFDDVDAEPHGADHLPSTVEIIKY